jgi:uncharacterized membrane protein YczE
MRFKGSSGTRNFGHAHMPTIAKVVSILILRVGIRIITHAGLGASWYKPDACDAPTLTVGTAIAN